MATDRTRKPRTESLQARLGLAGSERLRDELVGGMSYRDAVQWVWAEFRQKTSLGAISNFFDAVCKPYLAERISSSARIAEALAEADEGKFDAGTSQRLKQLTFEILLSDSANLDERKDLLAAYLKLRGQEANERKLALYEAKARRLDEIEAKAKSLKEGGGLSDETLEMLEQKLKLL